MEVSVFHRILRPLAITLNTLTWAALVIVLLPALMEGGDVFSAISWVALIAIPLSFVATWRLSDDRDFLVRYQGVTAFLAFGCHLGIASMFFQAQWTGPGIIFLGLAALTFVGWPYPTFGSMYDRYVQWWFTQWTAMRNQRAKGWDPQ